MRRKKWALMLAAPLLLSGCGVLDTLTGGGSGSAAAGATPSPGESWLVYAGGSATPSVKPTFPAGTPTPSPTSGFLPLGNVPRPTGTPVNSCSHETFNFGEINSADATTSATGAVVSWYNVGGNNLVEFRVTAIGQDLVVGKQRDVGWVTVKPSGPCGTMTATIGNLSPRTGYVFSVDAVVVRRSGDGTHAATVARSPVIRTT